MTRGEGNVPAHLTEPHADCPLWQDSGSRCHFDGTDAHTFLGCLRSREKRSSPIRVCSDAIAGNQRKGAGRCPRRLVGQRKRGGCGRTTRDAGPGINLEATWVRWAVIIETVVLVVALIILGYPILFLVILLAIAGTVLDVRELINHVAASRLGLSSLVAAVALTRVATAAVALGALLGRKRPSQAA